GDQALELEKKISENIAKLHDDSRKLQKPGAGEKYLKGLISNHISVMRKATSLQETYSNRVVFLAANKGNTKFLVELIRTTRKLAFNDETGLVTNNVKVGHKEV
ncbi:hypothetical protein Tco_0544434, partial [Tanacetum coccineum]